ncbi:PspC domain-containing protein [Bifidobacterium sp. SO1]|uniref:PspC domain-containing protein n=1 Tax=Bifidobacterium sp. SO1 TaxID=2809029 RepID=UPI001BDCEF21|nr:PspC domain-containing protein [Bifidobacterium sp. SO1]MBT1160464.1 PspC domain-containing protein [Bifidobacterium sp. SO1]
MSNSYGPYAPQDGGTPQQQFPYSQTGSAPGDGTTGGSASGATSNADYTQQSHAGRNPYPYGRPASNGTNDVAARFFGWIRRSGITRSDDRWVGGVCGGLARYFGISPVLMRAIMIGALLFGGFGAAFYALAWFLLPDGRDGGILAERLFAGDWDWACLGVILCLVIGVGFPASGLFATAAAAFVLWLILERELRRQRGYESGAPNADGHGYGRPFDDTRPTGPTYGQPQYGQPGTPTAMPLYSSVADGASQTGTSPAASGGNPFIPSSGHAAPSGNPAFTAPEPAPAAHNAASAAPSGMPMPQPSAVRPMTSPYRAPQPKPRPVVARRKPAGPLVVTIVIGLTFIFAAVALFMTRSYTAASLIRSATLWIGATCVLVGLTILLLGIRGRRAGGLVPIAWLAGITAMCILAVNVSYSYIATRYVNQAYAVTNVRGYVEYAGLVNSGTPDYRSLDSEQFTRLSDGIAFNGNDYANDRVHIDLSDYARRPKHDATLGNGTTVRTNCPTGTIHFSVSQAQVFVTLPTGCPFAFGNSSAQNFTGANMYGSRFSALIGSVGDGLTFGGGTFSHSAYSDADWSGDSMTAQQADADDVTQANGADSAAWMRDYDYFPSDGSELLIDVPYLLSGRVFVRYPKHAVGNNADLFGASAVSDEQ